MNKVWTYLISKELDSEELKSLQQAGNEFVNDWTAHDNKLSAGFEIYKSRIIVVKVNEDVNNASGCSIDKLLRFVKQAETKFQIELLNRMLVAYENGEKVEVVHSSKIKDLLKNNVITENTLIYNTSVSNEAEFQQWKQPLKNTWLNKYLEKA
jgi:hypothetical protein